MPKELVLTADGLRKLQEEYDSLKTVKRKEVAEKIKVARGFGDLSENSEYDEAKNEQAIVEARIAELEAMLKIARVMDDRELVADQIHVGSTVKVRDLEFNEEDVYYIVGSTESDPINNKISDESPMGKALLGHKAGDRISVDAPIGTMGYDVINVTRT